MNIFKAWPSLLTTRVVEPRFGRPSLPVGTPHGWLDASLGFSGMSRRLGRAAIEGSFFLTRSGSGRSAERLVRHSRSRLAARGAHGGSPAAGTTLSTSSWSTTPEPCGLLLSQLGPRPTLIATPVQARAKRRAAAVAPVVRKHVLKNNQVKPKTLNLYTALKDEFEVNHRVKVDPDTDVKRVDSALDRDMTKLFFDGACKQSAATLMVALCFFMRIRARDAAFPMAKASLRGFGRLSRSSSREPAPWEAVCLMALWLVNHRSTLRHAVRAAALMLTQFDCYARPQATLALTKRHVVPAPVGGHPRAQFWALVFAPSDEHAVTKTGRQDDTVPLNTPEAGRDRIHLLVSALYRKCSEPEEKMFPFTLAVYGDLCRKSFSGAGLNMKPNITPHMLRHGGPSTDVLLKVRTLVEAQQRGCWACLASTLRYEKTGRLLKMLNQLTPAQRRDGAAAAHTLQTKLPELIRNL